MYLFENTGGHDSQVIQIQSTRKNKTCSTGQKGQAALITALKHNIPVAALLSHVNLFSYLIITMS